MWRPLILSLLLALAPQLALASNTCTVSRTSLGALPTLSFTVAGDLYTFGFCGAVQPPNPPMDACTVPGYVVLSNGTTGSCETSFSVVVSDIALLGNSTGVRYALRDAADSIRANVTIQCDYSGSASEAALVEPIEMAVDEQNKTTLGFTLLSYAGCSVDAFFCSSEVACSDSTKSCLQGVCFDTNCAELVSASLRVSPPAVFISEVSVQDCHGSPLIDVPNTSFAIAVNGIDVNDPRIRDEVTLVIQPAPESPVPIVTTLVLDQSRSVTKNYQSTIKEAATAFANTMQTNTNQYVGVIAFDGSANPTVVLPHSNDRQAVVGAITSGLPPTSLADPDSTNLYGAVIRGLTESYRMKYSFGETSSPVISSMLVFTDGYDTAGRESRASAINKAIELAHDVMIVSVGVAETADEEFLSAIATSGSYSFITVDSLVQQFTDIAARLNALTNNNYFVMLCVPGRGSKIPISVSLDSAQFPGVTPLEYEVDASRFTGGCNRSILTMEVEKSNVRNIDRLNATASLTRTIDAKGAYFFYFQFTTATEVVIRPTTKVFYVANERCFVSPYCYDDSFNVSLVASSTVRYDAMVVSEETTTLTVTISATSPSPTTASPTSSTAAPTTAPGVTALPAAESLEKAPGDIDDGAAIVFLVYGCVTFLSVMFWFFIGHCVEHTTRPAHGAHFIPYHSPARPQFSGSPRALSREREIELEARLLNEPVYTGVQPYRGTPYSSSQPLSQPLPRVQHESLAEQLASPAPYDPTD